MYRKHEPVVQMFLKDAFFTDMLEQKVELDSLRCSLSAFQQEMSCLFIRVCVGDPIASG